MTTRRKRRTTRTEHLQTLWNKLPAHYQPATVEFRPGRGWFTYGEPRHFGDDGYEFLAFNWREAERILTGWHS